MPPKYHIKTAEVPNRFQAITRSGVIAWDEGCLKCRRCVKKDCVYKVYEKRGLEARQMLDSLDTACKDCFRCVQGCPNRLIQKGLNPQYKALGDPYWTPEIISVLWSQAESGRIPVSGAGYGGPFSGPGFDAMWTDMSEIVRPTRDGIHGREYISTTVDLGRKVMALEFDAQGRVATPMPPLVEIPLPIIFDLLPWSPPGGQITLAFLEAAQALGTFVVMRQSEMSPDVTRYLANVILCVDADMEGLDDTLLNDLSIIEIPDSDHVMELQGRVKERNPKAVAFIRMELHPHASKRVVQLAYEGAEVLHLVADEHGREKGENPLFIKERMREIHGALVEEGVRDEVTLVASGGIAMAEHMAKIIICGADALGVDIPLLVAMECRVCRRCQEGLACPVELESVDARWGAGRIKNLVAAWHNQLLEVLGAMGMREARRLRGEMGRAMFFEDLEREVFAPLGKRV
jgi:ferredoxin